MTQQRPICCGKPMMKAGSGWSGKRRVQVYRCNVCGRRILNSKEDYIRKGGNQGRKRVLEGKQNG